MEEEQKSMPLSVGNPAEVEEKQKHQWFVQMIDEQIRLMASKQPYLNAYQAQWLGEARELLVRVGDVHKYVDNSSDGSDSKGNDDDA